MWLFFISIYLLCFGKDIASQICKLQLPGMKIWISPVVDESFLIVGNSFIIVGNSFKMETLSFPCD